MIDTPQHCTDLALAIAEFERALPGWWYTAGKCSVSRDASCGPDRTGPDAHLLGCRIFDNGFHFDDPADESTMAGSLREVLALALDARAAAATGRRPCIERGEKCRCTEGAA